MKKEREKKKIQNTKFNQTKEIIIANQSNETEAFLNHQFYAKPP